MCKAGGIPETLLLADHVPVTEIRRFSAVSQAQKPESHTIRNVIAFLSSEGSTYFWGAGANVRCLSVFMYIQGVGVTIQI